MYNNILHVVNISIDSQNEANKSTSEITLSFLITVSQKAKLCSFWCKPFSAEITEDHQPCSQGAFSLSLENYLNPGGVGLLSKGKWMLVGKLKLDP